MRTDKNYDKNKTNLLHRPFQPSLIIKSGLIAEKVLRVRL